MTTCLVYIHIGNNLPEYFYDSLYQTLLVNNYETKIYIVVEECEIENLVKRLRCFNLDELCVNDFLFENVVNIVPLHLLDQQLTSDTAFQEYKALAQTKYGQLAEFRNGFWISTTARFYYILALVKSFALTNVFHIENDIMMYTSFCDIHKYIKKNGPSKICMVKDAPDRVVPSLLYFPVQYTLSALCSFITKMSMHTQSFMNDMNILGAYPPDQMITFPIENERVIYDGAAFGQYIGGVDLRNLPDDPSGSVFENKTRGFVNETSIVKPNDYSVIKRELVVNHIKFPINFYTIVKKTDTRKISQLANLHVHSKQLYNFSGIFNINYEDIISGDRILGLCDFVMVTKDIYNFHKNIGKYAKDIILINDFKSVNISLLNRYFRDVKGKHVKIALYTHILESFCEFVVDHLDPSLKYIFYIHNSDHSFHSGHARLLDKPYVHKVFAQNIDFPSLHAKLCLLPIGIANSMWPHGDLDALYHTMRSSYMYKKTRDMYVNINPATHPYRKELLQDIQLQNNLTLSVSKPYKEYLEELSSHRFCLCTRGNGLDTHRFWEALYLGVIPVVINNHKTGLGNFVKYLKQLDVPFLEINDEYLSKYQDNYFNQDLYQKVLSKHSSYIHNTCSMKLSSVASK